VRLNAGQRAWVQGAIYDNFCRGERRVATGSPSTHIDLAESNTHTPPHVRHTPPRRPRRRREARLPDLRPRRPCAGRDRGTGRHCRLYPGRPHLPGGSRRPCRRHRAGYFPPAGHRDRPDPDPFPGRPRRRPHLRLGSRRVGAYIRLPRHRRRPAGVPSRLRREKPRTKRAGAAKNPLQRNRPHRAPRRARRRGGRVRIHVRTRLVRRTAGGAADAGAGAAHARRHRARSRRRWRKSPSTR
jgi:hypothetical protein